jgi:regulator of sirC expression with transglutaminase-like and TPR domain
VTEAYTAAQASYKKAEEAYDRLAAAAPRDPNVQLELAQAAQQSGDVAKAIKAYERFIALAPDDPTAPIVKQQIAQLKASQAAPPSG